MTLNRRAAWVLVVTCAWTLYVWITRMWVISHDSHGFAFKAVHAVLAIISVGLGVAVGVIGWRGLQATKRSAGDDRGEPLAAQHRPEP